MCVTSFLNGVRTALAATMVKVVDVSLATWAVNGVQASLPTWIATDNMLMCYGMF